jgi:D-cysteine desulfhydrase
MEEIKNEKGKERKNSLIIPEGASNGIGSLGYYNAFLEIAAQEKAMNMQFDAIVVAVGSGGTYAGLMLGKMVTKRQAILPGYLVGGSKEYFKGEIERIFREFSAYNGKIDCLPDTYFIDDYIGRGYGLNVPEELEFIKEMARLEGVVFDNVYTGKALYGLVTDIRKGKYAGMKNILFIHTGGLFEMFSQNGVV